MEKVISKNPLVKKVVEGSAKIDLLDMVVDRMMPFTDEEYLESLVFLLKSEQYKIKAINQLREISATAKANYVERPGANHRVCYFVLLEGLEKKNHTILTRIIRNQALPYEFLITIAKKGDETILEMLLDNQIKLIAYPQILQEMEANPTATNFIKGKIEEFREYYLQDLDAEEIPATAVLEDMKILLSKDKEEKGQAAEEEPEKDDQPEPDADEGEGDDELLSMEEVEQKTLTLLQEINQMSIPERIKLALGGNRTQRTVLIRDPNKMVSLSVLESPKITIDEISLIVRNRSLPGELIARICRRREWVRIYPIMFDLLLNPKTPIKHAMAYIKSLHDRDLDSLSRNKNINPAIRQYAYSYSEQKKRKKRR